MHTDHNVIKGQRSNLIKRLDEHSGMWKDGINDWALS